MSTHLRSLRPDTMGYVCFGVLVHEHESQLYFRLKLSQYAEFGSDIVEANFRS